MVKNPPANAGDVRDMGWIPGLGKFPGGGHDNPLQYSCWENSKDRRAWWATVHGVTNSQAGLSTHTHPLGSAKLLGRTVVENQFMFLGKAFASNLILSTSTAQLWGWQTFSVKGHLGNILGFAVRVVCFATT